MSDSSIDKAQPECLARNCVHPVMLSHLKCSIFLASSSDRPASCRPHRRAPLTYRLFLAARSCCRTPLRNCCHYLLRWTFIMSLACRIIGINNSRAYQYTEKKRFWLHDGHLPMPDKHSEAIPSHCQGLTLSRSVLDHLRIDPFTDGQLYAALSIRVRRREDCLLFFFQLQS